MQDSDRGERVAIPLDPTEALRALLKVDPESEPVEVEPRERSPEQRNPNGNPLAGPPRAAFCKLAYANKSTNQNACIGQADGR